LVNAAQRKKAGSWLALRKKSLKPMVVPHTKITLIEQWIYCRRQSDQAQDIGKGKGGKILKEQKPIYLISRVRNSS
jgi:hypothetical protein